MGGASCGLSAATKNRGRWWNRANYWTCRFGSSIWTSLAPISKSSTRQFFSWRQPRSQKYPARCVAVTTAGSPIAADVRRPACAGYACRLFTTWTRALTELRFAKEHGACGVLKKGDRETDNWMTDPYFFPFTRRREKLDLPICIHTGTGQPENIAENWLNGRIFL